MVGAGNTVNMSFFTARNYPRTTSASGAASLTRIANNISTRVAIIQKNFGATSSSRSCGTALEYKSFGLLGRRCLTGETIAETGETIAEFGCQMINLLVLHLKQKLTCTVLELIAHMTS